MRRATLRRMSVSFQFRARSVRMQYGDRPCLRTFVLMTTADTAAELGCKRWQNARACVCRTIRPAADRGKAVPALPATASPWRAGREAANLPGRFSRRTVPAALFLPFSMIDKFSPAFLPSPRLAAAAGYCGKKRHKSRSTLRVLSDFSCLCSSQIFDFRCAAKDTGSCYFMVIPRRQWAHEPLVSLCSSLAYSALNTGQVYQTGRFLHRWKISNKI